MFEGYFCLLGFIPKVSTNILKFSINGKFEDFYQEKRTSICPQIRHWTYGKSSIFIIILSIPQGAVKTKWKIFCSKTERDNILTN